MRDFTKCIEVMICVRRRRQWRTDATDVRSGTWDYYYYPQVLGEGAQRSGKYIVGALAGKSKDVLKHHLVRKVLKYAVVPASFLFSLFVFS